MSKPNILILSAQVPFTRGGAELLIEGLNQQLKNRGLSSDIVSLPFSALPKQNLAKQVALWRSLDLQSFAGRKVDLVIATKFPTYMVNHPRKITWLIHQHRQLYELFGSRFGDFSASPEDEALRRMLLKADRLGLAECSARYTISENVSARLERYLGLDSNAILPPLPLGDAYYSAHPQNYILSVGRLCSIKRIDMIIKSLPMISDTLSLKIVGAGDEPAIEEYLHSEVRKHHLKNRVEFLGRVDDSSLLKLYAEAFAVYYAPFDEDYGFVTLEALASGKPVITANDSGTVLEFVRDGENGLVTEPRVEAIASSINRLVDEPDLYSRLARGAKPVEINSWDVVVERLLSSLNKEAVTTASRSVEPSSSLPSEKQVSRASNE